MDKIIGLAIALIDATKGFWQRLSNFLVSQSLAQLASAVFLHLLYLQDERIACLV